MWLSVPMALSIQATPQMSNAASKPIYSEAFTSKPEAMSAEARFKKKSREKKLAYIKEHTEK